jgi:uncharacterized OB-fold protein
MNAIRDTPSLSMVRCAACGRVDTPRRAVCSACLANQLEPIAIPGNGVVASFTTIRRAPTQFRDRAPYDVVVVDLDAGLRVTGRLDAQSSPAAVGARVGLVSAEGSDTVFAVSQT